MSSTNNLIDMPIPYELRDDWIPEIAKSLAAFTPEEFVKEQNEGSGMNVPEKIQQLVAEVLVAQQSLETPVKYDYTDSIDPEDFDLNAFEKFVEEYRDVLGDYAYGTNGHNQYSEVLCVLDAMLREYWKEVWTGIYTTNIVLMMASVAVELAKVDRACRHEWERGQ